jgi:hypothetical protein
MPLAQLLSEKEIRKLHIAANFVHRATILTKALMALFIDNNATTFCHLPSKPTPTNHHAVGLSETGKQPLIPEMSLQILYDAKQQTAETLNFFSH